MIRIHAACLALSVLALPTVLRAQDWRDDDSIWGFGNIGGPHRTGPREPDPAPIVPAEWIAVPETSGEAALLAFPWILDPERAAPRAGEDGWTARLGVPLAAAACAYASVHSDADEVRMARLTGARWLVVNGSVHIGDPERRGDRGVPVALKKGENRVFVVEATAGWELELWKPATRCVIGTWDVGWPNTTGDDEAVHVPVFNASCDRLNHLHVHFGHFFVPTQDHPGIVERWVDGGCIAPLSIWRANVTWWSISEQRAPGRAGNRAPVVVYGDEDPEAARAVLCDLDASYERGRLSPHERERGRAALGARPQARIPGRALLVYGTQGDAETDRALLARARLDQQVLWYECGDVPLVVSDTQLVEPASDGQHWCVQKWASFSDDPLPVVLYGDVATNAAWTPLRVSGASLEPDAQGIIRRNDAFYGAQVVGADAWTQARAPIPGGISARSVLAFASRGVDGARLSLALSMSSAQDSYVRVDPESKSGFSPLPSGK